MESQIEREWQLMKNADVLVANGIMLFDDDEDQPGCGRMVFWLGEIPLHKRYTTESGTEVERVRSDKVRVRFSFSRGDKLISVPPKPRELDRPAASKRGTEAWGYPHEEDDMNETISMSFSSFSSNPRQPSVSTTSSAPSAFHEGSSSSFMWGLFRSSSSAKTASSTKVASPAEVNKTSRRDLAPSSSTSTSATASVKDRARKKAAADLGELAEDEGVQERSGALLARLAGDKKVQTMVGEAFADNAENSFMAKLARNPKVQEKVASKVAAAATNKTVQKKVGQAVRNLAENEEAQAKAASMLGSLVQAAIGR